MVLDRAQLREVTLEDEALMREILAALIADTEQQMPLLDMAIRLSLIHISRGSARFPSPTPALAGRRMGFRRFLVCVLPLLVGAAQAQDDRKVVSPDGRLEFRLFTTLPAGAQLNSLAYQVRLGGKLLIDTSCMGLDIHFQEPLLGENVGLSVSKTLQGDGYNGL